MTVRLGIERDVRITVDDLFHPPMLVPAQSSALRLRSFRTIGSMIKLRARKTGRANAAGNAF